MGKLLRLLVLACAVHGVEAQGLFKGFIPDENGTNLDAPIQRAKLAVGTTFKDCPECPEMVVLPSGSFLMGSPPDPGPDPFSDEKPKPIGEPEEKPQHSVQVQSFSIGKYEVTQEQWVAVMGDNPSVNKGRTRPAERVSWDDIQKFIGKLNQKTGQKYRLPSEAEWEYAARAGTTTEWSCGNDVSKLVNYAWYSATPILGNSLMRDSHSAPDIKGKEGESELSRTHIVGQKLPNAFGLFDMQGNVWEWTQDCWHKTYDKAPTDGSAWTTGCMSNNRMLRGGSWSDSSAYLRFAGRFVSKPDVRIDRFGFRLARDL